MPNIPLTGYMCLKQIIGDFKSEPPVIPIIPVGNTTWWEGVKSGRFPKPIKLGPRTTVWRVEDIQCLLEKESFGFEPMQEKLCKKK